MHATVKDEAVAIVAFVATFAVIPPSAIIVARMVMSPPGLAARQGVRRIIHGLAHVAVYRCNRPPRPMPIVICSMMTMRTVLIDYHSPPSYPVKVVFIVAVTTDGGIVVRSSRRRRHHPGHDHLPPQPTATAIVLHCPLLLSFALQIR